MSFIRILNKRERKDSFNGDFNMLNRVFRHSTRDIEMYFDSFYDSYVSSVVVNKPIVKRFNAQSNKIEKNFMAGLKSLHSKAYENETDVLDFVKEWSKKTINHYVSNEKKIVKNDFRIKSLEEFKGEVESVLRWSDFIINSNDTVDIYDRYEDSTKGIINSMKGSVSEITSVELSLLEWIFKLKHELSLINKRTTRVYRTKLIEMHKLYNNSPSSLTIKNIIDSFDSLFAYNKSDYDLIIDSICIDVNTFDKRLYRAFTGYRDTKRKLLESYQDFKEEVFYNLNDNSSLFIESVREDCSAINKIGKLIFETTIASEDHEFLEEFRRDFTRVNNVSKKKWESYNEELILLSEKTESDYEEIIDKYYNLISSTLRINEIIKSSSTELSVVYDLNLSLVNNLIKYIFQD